MAWQCEESSRFIAVDWSSSMPLLALSTGSEATAVPGPMRQPGTILDIPSANSRPNFRLRLGERFVLSFAPPHPQKPGGAHVAGAKSRHKRGVKGLNAAGTSESGTPPVREVDR